MTRFKITAFVLTSTLWALAPAAADAGTLSDWATVQNKRYGFQIAYPAKVLFPAPTPSGEDGRVLKSADGQAKMLVATFENSENLSLEAYRKFLMTDIYAGTKLDYAPQRSRWFVLSGTRGKETFYERITFTCNGALINSWAMTYPTAQKTFYDSIVEIVAKTYTPGSGAQGNCSGIAAATQPPQR